MTVWLPDTIKVAKMHNNLVHIASAKSFVCG